MMMVEHLARTLATRHFMRKQHPGACSVEDRITWMVNRYWEGWIADAEAVIDAINDMAAKQERTER